MLNGVQSLTDVELLAIFIRSGNKKYTALDIALNLLKEFGTFSNILNASYVQLMVINGVGPVVATQLCCVSEIKKRAQQKINKIVKTPSDVINLTITHFTNYSEKVVVVFLNKQNIIIHTLVVAQGPRSEVVFDISKIISEALRYFAAKIYCIHNHPSGDLKPSRSDIDAFNFLKVKCDQVNIKLQGCIIVNNKNEFAVF